MLATVLGTAHESLFKLCWVDLGTSSEPGWTLQRQGSIMVGDSSPWSQAATVQILSRCANLLRGQVWTSNATALGLSFLIYKMGML